MARLLARVSVSPWYPSQRGQGTSCPSAWRYSRDEQIVFSHRANDSTRRLHRVEVRWSAKRGESRTTQSGRVEASGTTEWGIRAKQISPKDSYDPVLQTRIVRLLNLLLKVPWQMPRPLVFLKTLRVLPLRGIAPLFSRTQSVTKEKDPEENFFKKIFSSLPSDV